MASSASVHSHKKVMVTDILKTFSSCPSLGIVENATLDIEF